MGRLLGSRTYQHVNLTLYSPDLPSGRADSPLVPITTLPVRKKAVGGPGAPEPIQPETVVRRPDPRNRSRVDRWRGVSLLEEDAAERSPLREGGGDPVVGVVAALAHLGDVGRASGCHPRCSQEHWIIVVTWKTEAMLSSGENRLKFGFH